MLVEELPEDLAKSGFFETVAYLNSFNLGCVQKLCDTSKFEGENDEKLGDGMGIQISGQTHVDSKFPHDSAQLFDNLCTKLS